ncbi:hypothetical protein VTL71DRAFT_8105 [Oculimacula yallundae]|uniref:ribonuclease T1 n=1 Tax=Oculimacula yallundae TaxID=86028 RepID=A0ABR4CXL0_9HELO
MFGLKTFLPLILLFTTATSLPVLEERAAHTCGSTAYSAAAVNAAAQKACSYYKSGSAPGGYPHTYNNYEGFSFGGVAGPYQEFPIPCVPCIAEVNLSQSCPIYHDDLRQDLDSNTFAGSPGADRVIINVPACKQAGAITHTGASGNNFVACSGTN